MHTAQPLPEPVRKADRLLAHYGQSHRNAANEAIHLLAIPAIMLAIVGLLHAVHPWVAYAFLAASLGYYLRLGAPVLVVGMVFWTALLLAAVHALGAVLVPVSVALFVAGWVAQFVGHRLEGRKPSFFEDLQYLWVGPLFVLTRLLDRLHLRW